MEAAHEKVSGISYLWTAVQMQPGIRDIPRTPRTSKDTRSAKHAAAAAAAPLALVTCCIWNHTAAKPTTAAACQRDQGPLEARADAESTPPDLPRSSLRHAENKTLTALCGNDCLAPIVAQTGADCIASCDGMHQHQHDPIGA